MAQRHEDAKRPARADPVGAVDVGAQFDLADEVGVVFEDLLGIPGLRLVANDGEPLADDPVLDGGIDLRETADERCREPLAVPLAGFPFHRLDHRLDLRALPGHSLRRLVDPLGIASAAAGEEPAVEEIGGPLVTRQGRRRRRIRAARRGEAVEGCPP